MSKKIVQQLPVKLTDQEKLTYGRESSRLVREIEVLEDQKKESASGFKSKIDTATNRIRLISEAIYSGVEYRAVECRKEVNALRSTVRIIREDTGAVVEERPLTQSEQQMNLDELMEYEEDDDSVLETAAGAA